MDDTPASVGVDMMSKHEELYYHIPKAPFEVLGMFLFSCFMILFLIGGVICIIVGGMMWGAGNPSTITIPTGAVLFFGGIAGIVIALGSTYYLLGRY